MLNLTVTFADGNQIHTSFNGTSDEACAYYKGEFNLGDGAGGDKIVKVKSVVIHNTTMEEQTPAKGLEVSHADMIRRGAEFLEGIINFQGSLGVEERNILEMEIPSGIGRVTTRLIEPERAVVDVRWGEFLTIGSVRVTYYLTLK